MSTKIGLALLPVTLFGFCCLAQPAANEQIDSFLQVMEQNHLFNGSILVAKEGKVVYHRSYGYWDGVRKIPNSDTTCFNLASLSKPFTALAVLQLVQKGKIRLEDTFVSYFPDFPYPGITIRHLLSHTSGLPQLEVFERQYIDQHPDELITGKDAYSHLSALKLPLLFTPGDRWAYSNLGYAFLALLVERVSRMPFEEYMRKYIFLPAGMRYSISGAQRLPIRRGIPSLRCI